MKIALASQFSDNDIYINAKLINKSIISLKGQADLICFGEAFLHGFNALSWDYEKDKEIAIPVKSNHIKEIQLSAKQNKTAVSFGFYELNENSIFCSYVFIDKNGEILAHYRRVSPGWKDVTKCDYHYKEGGKFSAFGFRGKKFLIAVCGDLWDDINIEIIRTFKVDAVLWPSHLDYTIKQWENELQDYLIQTSKLKKPALLINNISATSHGGCYLFEDGKVMNKLSMGEEGFLIITNYI